MATDQTMFTFQVPRQVAEALGEVEIGALVNQSIGVHWGDHEAQARIAAVQISDEAIAVTMIIDERLPMGEQLGGYSLGSQVTDG